MAQDRQVHDWYELGYSQAKSGYYREPLYPNNHQYMEGWECWINEILPELLKVEAGICRKN